MNLLRKLIALLTALTLCLSLAPMIPTASAAEIYITGTYTNPLYEDISDSLPVQIPGPAPLLADADYDDYLKTDDAVADALREGMKSRTEQIVLYFQTDYVIENEEQLETYFLNILSLAQSHTGIPTEGDSLRWQYGSVGYGLRGSSSGGFYYWTLTATFSFYTTAAQENTLTREINNLLEELDVSSENDYVKIKAIYDYICANVVYDNANLNNDSYVLKYTPYAALMNGTAVCQGYALLFYRLALELGVDTRLIAGDGGGPHGWNIAELNHLYYNLDSTWDAGSTEYEYFLRSSDNFHNHTRSEEYDTDAFHREYPMAAEDFDVSTVVCTHAYTSTVTKEPGCTTRGVTTYTCSKCGNSYTEETAALGHAEVTDPAVAATCTQTGKTQGSHCSRCNEILVKQTETQALGHTNVVDPAVAPSCTEPGKTEGSHCGRCNEVFTAQESVPATGHDWDDATCTAPETCLVCQATQGQPLGHDWNEGTVTKEPTENETGVLTRKCNRCDETKDETIPELSHEHSYTTKVTAPTCTEKGYTTYTCACGDSFTENEVAPLDHNWDDGTVTKEPTETETGIRTYKCSRCDETKTEEIPVLSHTHAYTTTVIDPTCTETGYTAYICDCGDSFTRNEVEALGHSWDSGVVTREPTPHQAGVCVYTCTRCTETRSEEVPYPAYIEPVRLEGLDRSETALRVAEALRVKLDVDRFNSVIISNGNGFADALAGSYLAAVKGAPILLLKNTNTFDSANETYILNNLVSGGTVYILGGTAAVSTQVEDSLKAAGYHVVRLSGQDRFETNLEILKEAGVGKSDEILIATGWNYADSLSASATGKPILIVNEAKNSLTEDQIQFLKDHASNKYTIIGGEAAISKALEDAINAIVETDVDRVYGETREDTSVKVAQRYFKNPDMVLIAYSRNFPDGLCGGPLAYAYDAPLLLTCGGQESFAAQYVNSEGISGGFVLGGSAAVSDQSLTLIFGETE